MILIEPDSPEAAADAVAEAALAHEPLEVVGGGALSGYGRPVAAPRRLSTRRLDRIHFYEPDELVISLEAGVDMDRVEAELAAAGQRLAFEPPNLSRLLGTGATRTIGGVVGANLSGPRRPQAGAARDHLLGFVAVNGRGEQVKSGGRVVKNVTGYDLSKLIAGSWGTLAVMTTVTLKVLPRPEAELTVLVPGLDAEAAVRLFARALGQPLDVTATAWLPAALSAPWSNSPVAALRLEGISRSVAERFDDIAALTAGAPVERLDAADSQDFWREIGDVSRLAEPRDRLVWRLSVPPSAGPGLLNLLPEATGFLDWSGGLIWLAVEARGDCGAAALRAHLAVCGGHGVLVRAAPDQRAAIEAGEPPPSALTALAGRVKDAFDPLRVLNPGRLYREG